MLQNRDRVKGFPRSYRIEISNMLADLNLLLSVVSTASSILSSLVSLYVDADSELSSPTIARYNQRAIITSQI